MKKQNRRNIAFIVNSTGFYGGERRVHQILDGFSAYKNLKLVLFVNTSIASRYSDLKHVSIQELPPKPLGRFSRFLYYSRLQFYMRREIARRRVDLIAVCLYSAFLATLLVRLTSRTKFLGIMVGEIRTITRPSPEEPHFFSYKIACKMLWKPLIKSYHGFIAANEDDHKCLRTLTQKPSILVRMFMKILSDVPYEKKNKKMILFPHRLIPIKGTAYLARLVPELAKLDPKIEVVLVGRGPQEQEVKEKLKEWKSNVKFVGHVPDTDEFMQEAYVGLQLHTAPSYLNVTGMEMINRCCIIATVYFPEHENYQGNVVFLNEKSAFDDAKRIISMQRNREEFNRMTRGNKQLLKKHHSMKLGSKRIYNFILALMNK